MKPKHIFIILTLLGIGVAVFWWFAKSAAKAPAPAKVAKAPVVPGLAVFASAPKPAQVEAPKVAPAVPGSSSLGGSNQQQSNLLPRFLTSPAEQAALKIKIDDLISNAPTPLVTGDSRLWEPDPADPETLRRRPDAATYFLSDGTEVDDRVGYSVEVYYISSENRFYFCRISAPHGAPPIYGPFEGDPAVVLGLIR